MEKAEKEHAALARQVKSMLPERSKRHQEVLEFYRKELFKDKPLPVIEVPEINRSPRGRRKPLPDYEVLTKLAEFYKRPQYQIDALNYYRQEFERRGNLKVDPSVREELQRKADNSPQVRRQIELQRRVDASPYVQRKYAEREALQAKVDAYFTRQEEQTLSLADRRQAAEKKPQLLSDRELFLTWKAELQDVERAAIATEESLREALRQKDPVAFAEQYTDFSHGAYEIFGPEYREAYEHRQFVTSVLGQQEKIFNWIEDRCAKGLPPSIEAIDQQALGMVEAEQLVSGHIAPWVYAGLAAKGGVPGTGNSRKFFQRLRERLRVLRGKVKKSRQIQKKFSDDSFSYNKYWDNLIKKGDLGNRTVRIWYTIKDEGIINIIDKSLPLQDQAAQAWALRNFYRTRARMIMRNKSLADKLWRDKPMMSWKDVVNKYKAKGFHGNNLWKEIIKNAQKSNQNVNKSLGIK